MWDSVFGAEGTDLRRLAPARDGPGGGGKPGLLQVLWEHSRECVRSGKAASKKKKKKVYLG